MEDVQWTCKRKQRQLSLTCLYECFRNEDKKARLVLTLDIENKLVNEALKGLTSKEDCLVQEAGHFRQFPQCSFEHLFLGFQLEVWDVL